MPPATPSDTFVSVVAPIRDDGAILKNFVTETLEVLRSHYANYELILVDNGSTDETHQYLDHLLANETCLRVMELSRAFDKDVAIDAGLESSIGDFVVVMTPESDPAQRIPDMVNLCRGSQGIIIGVPQTDTDKHASAPIHRLGSKLLHFYFRKVLHIDLHPGASDFHVLSRQAVNAITRIRDRRRHLRHFVSTIGFGVTTVPYVPIQRSGRDLTPSFASDLNKAIDLIVASSNHPLRFVSALGLFASGLNLLYVLYVVVIYFIKPDVAQGWTTISFVQGLMFFLVFLIFSVTSEYIGRVLEEAQQRPLYFVRGERNSSVLLADTQRRNVVDTPESNESRPQ